MLVRFTTDACPFHNGTLSVFYKALFSVTATAGAGYAATGIFFILQNG
jgi:hypothetical protein